eukprot:TRINITY_DN4206_c0_g1_i1.p2 TRINITY_DN4206_c0_g1~~TRINITY_DN4206_c0_g1_i1.p2  ORF type:complete len:478 (-),score=86.67 TRINITY_DN4206_c0_g1_i1:25-1458(-)
MQAELTQRCTQRRAEIEQLISQITASNDVVLKQYQEEQARIQERYKIVDAYETRHRAKELEINLLERKIKLLQEEAAQKTSEITTLQVDEEQWLRRLQEIDTAPRPSEPSGTTDLTFGIPTLLASIQANESRLRTLEDQLLATQQQVDQKGEAISRLQQERSAIQAERAQEREVLTRTLHENNVMIDSLKEELEGLRLKNIHPESRLRELQEQRQRTQDNVTVLYTEQQRLHEELQMALEQRKRSEEDVKRRLRTLSQNGDSAEVRQKLDETMMLLKAAAINLHHDYQLIGQIRADTKNLDPVQREEVFNRSYAATKHCVAEIYGAEKMQGSQWALEQPELPTGTSPGKLEQLLLSIKQMVIAYDMLPLKSKTQMKEAGPVIENSYYLYSIVKHATQRLKDIEIERSRAKTTTGAPKRSTSASHPRAGGTPPHPAPGTNTRQVPAPRPTSLFTEEVKAPVTAPRIAGKVTTTLAKGK